ncbi:hypothetical protein DMUE_1079 [Dictyocoela muelleri]|nr:hypothetical protein DMUE_1079 [Dictyocoela muelleri]
MNTKLFLNILEHTYFLIISTNENTYRYPPFFSFYDRIINDIPRSTNAVERLHRAINNSTTISHPNLARFIIILKNLAEKNKNFIITSLIWKFYFHIRSEFSKRR